ncbi:MAG TPA: YeeE/YedE thiosulfate transporter family protein [Ktedonobacterales bacterium]|nr:YeeE/YedE thiosulfate transporter family protein [Ktedonobacterales bacterium]
MGILPYQVPWYTAGPVIGLLVIGVYAVMNARLGVSSSYRAVARALAHRPVHRPAERWRVWFFAGLALGALLASALRGGWRLSLGYGALELALPLVLVVPLLFVGGLCMGYGARWAGGCTSGHGISGTASRSPASWAATLTFIVVAVTLSLLLHFVLGGAL